MSRAAPSEAVPQGLRGGEELYRRIIETTHLGVPLLYQVGLGYSPIQSGLLILPQSLAAISLKMTMPVILSRFGYRRVLLTNTVLLGLLIGVFATVGPHTPVALICLHAVAFGFLSSLQFTSMNTLAYADVTEADASMASTIVSTMQQMSMSFGPMGSRRRCEACRRGVDPAPA